MRSLNSGNQPIQQGVIIGVGIALKLALGYSAVLALMTVFVSLNPIIFVSTFFFAILVGGIPAVFLGGLAGLIIGLLYSLSGDSLSEWKIVGIGWILGIAFALLLPMTITFMINDGEISIQTVVETLRGFSLFLVCPSLITIFAVGWLVRKIGEPFRIATMK